MPSSSEWKKLAGFRRRMEEVGIDVFLPAMSSSSAKTGSVPIYIYIYSVA